MKKCLFHSQKLFEALTLKLCFFELLALKQLYIKRKPIIEELRNQSSIENLEFIKNPTSKISSKWKLWTPCPHHTIQLPRLERGTNYERRRHHTIQLPRLERGTNYDFSYIICYPDPHLHSAILLSAFHRLLH